MREEGNVGTKELGNRGAKDQRNEAKRIDEEEKNMWMIMK